MAPFFAHTPPPSGGDFQPLQEHLANTAQLAAEFARPLGLGDLARTAGILHDVGKYADAFQQYLRDCEAARQTGTPPPRRGVDHKSAGALLALARSELLAWVIAGHHGGLPDTADLQARIKQAQADPVLTQTAEQACSELQGITLPAASALNKEASTLASSALEADVLLRLLFSCLADADSLDTERHFTPETAQERGTDVSLATLWKSVSAAQATLMTEAADNVVNRVRRQVYEDCLEAAALPPGVFKLTVPTGGGKTRSSLAFALRHALAHGMERVIYAIPYTSIIEQTADVFRRILPFPHAVLEHHSAVPEREDEDEETARWRRLASENWDAPLIVTTTVQLFESLFAAGPGRCRKAHRVARSVLILDEAQTLPPPLLAPILDMLRTLVTRYGVTVVLCTATQPALEGESRYLRGLPPAREIVREPERHFQALRRVHYQVDAEPWSWEQTATALRAEKQALAVLNTKKDALALLDALADPQALYLSTLLCGAHRRKVLEEVRKRLENNDPCRLISTQVIEAGVDVDFPLVLRAMGPLDRIVQAAGRCNREGRREYGTVVVFNPAAGSHPPGVYRTAVAHALQMLRDPALDFDDPSLFQAYFSRLFQDVETDAPGIQRDREKLRFATVAAKFRLIGEDTTPVLVPYDPDQAAEIVAEAQRARHVSRALWRRAQPYCVSLFQHELKRRLRDGMVEEVVPGSGLYRWLGSYDPVRGLAGDNAVEPADLIA